MHVVLRTTVTAQRLRQNRIYLLFRDVLEALRGRADFRIVHVSLQHNHVHLIVEADDRRALAKGMQSFAIRFAKAFHAQDGMLGRLFAGRYHATQIKTPRQCRSTINYVLNNWRRHREDLASAYIQQFYFDPYSSGPSFTGWSSGPGESQMPDAYAPLPTSRPQTRLLQTDWKAHGLLDPFARPGPLWT